MRERIWRPEDCPIHSVVVYLKGAQVQRAGLLTLPAGESSVILSVEHRINHLVEADVDADIESLQEELERLQESRRHKQAMLLICSGQEEMLVANRSMAGADTGLRAAELREGVCFYRECMEDIKTRQLLLEKELEELDRKSQQLQQQLGDMSGKSMRPVSGIVLRVGAVQEGDVSLNLSYFVGDAGWVPSYDIRARDADSPIRVSCKARISQTTHEDWRNVRLTISTGSPSGNAVCPELEPWRLDFEHPQHQGKSSVHPSFNAASVRKSASFELAEPAPSARGLPVAAAPAPQPVGAAVDRSLTTVDYRIPTPYTIASGQGEQTVEMVAHDVTADYQYRSVRKLDKEVYLIAKVRDYARLNLVAGEASVFFGGKYVGRTFIDPRKGEEEMDWSLGADPSVVVTRIKGKSFTAGGLGGNRKVTREWELTARNLKDRPISMQLQDQVPVSANKQIQVETTEVSGALQDADTGILQWEFALDPSESRTFRVRYVVIHPKHSIVHLD